jgi:hypothetical protein
MAKKNDTPWISILALAAGLWWLFSSPASASPSAATPTLGAAAQRYMSQIVAAQNAFLSGSKTQLEYNALALAAIAAAQLDQAVTPADVAALRAVAGV